MTTWVHNPALLSHADGFVLANAATTDVAAGAVLTAVTSAGGTITYQTDTWQSVGNSGAARLDLPIGAAARIAVEVYFELTAVPTGAENRILEFMGSAGFALRLTQLTSGQLRLFNSANASLWTSAASYTAGQKVRLFVAAEPGSTTANGKFRWNIYTADNGLSTTPAETFTTDAGNAGAAITIASVRFNRITSTAASTATIRLINLQAKDTDLTPIGPLLPDSSVLFYSPDGTTLLPVLEVGYSADGLTITPIV